MSGGDSAAGTGKSEAAKSPDLPLPSPPAELLSPSEENSIYGRMIKSCHATLERPTRHQTSGTAQAVIGQGGAGGYHHSPDQSSTYHDDHNAYLGGICSQITEKFGGADSSNSPNSNSYNNHNIYGMCSILRLRIQHFSAMMHSWLTSICRLLRNCWA